MPETKSSYFRHCEKPTTLPIKGQVTGNIPHWLNGTLIRNGPGIKKIGNEEFIHFFDGLALLHSFNIENGKVTYFNRPLESDTYKINMEAQRIAVSSLGPIAFHDPCDALFSKYKTDFVEVHRNRRSDNCSINVCYHGDQLYAMTETHMTRRIGPKTLESIGEAVDMTKYVAINRTTAHPHVLENGDVINIGNSFKPGSEHLTYTFVRVPAKFDTEDTCYMEGKVIAEIPARHANNIAYFHSFGLAGDNLILVEAPLWIDMRKFAGDRKIPYVKMLEWNPEEKTRFYVVSMTTGQVHPIVYETEGLFTLHHVNSYEEDGHIVIDLAAYDNGKFVPEDIYKGTIGKGYNSGGSGRRYVLPLNVEKSDTNLVTLKNTTATAHVVKTGDSVVVNVKGHTFYPSWLEFPRVNYNFNGKKYRYLYGTGSDVNLLEGSTGFPEPNLLVKVDLETDATLTWAEPNVVVVEPVFVPNPNDNQEEENGVVLVPLLYLDNSKKVTLLILDPKMFKEVGRVEFIAEGTIPLTFHGQWAQEGQQIHRY